MYEDFRKCLSELISCGAFELHPHISEKSQTDYYIPYMMNDALECFFILKNCQMTGNYLPDSKEEILIELITTDTSPALIIRQGNENVATLWFHALEKELKCYRYHEIGHFWVKGQEHWRQLVYIVGTIYDKFQYMGADICNEVELELLPLMEFMPFRYWSPIRESLNAYYINTSNGIDYMRRLCLEVCDRKYLHLLSIYKLFPSPFFAAILAKELAKSGHEKLYELIYKKMEKASSSYPARNYGEHFNNYILLQRKQAADYLYSKGYSGTYPNFSKKNIQILATEEQPFTVLEYENYHFRIQFMVSETKNSPCFLNQGFFCGKGNHSQIVKSLKDIL